MAGGEGFEPPLAESESAVLPLDEPPINLVSILLLSSLKILARFARGVRDYSGCPALALRVRYASRSLMKIRSRRIFQTPAGGVRVRSPTTRRTPRKPG